MTDSLELHCRCGWAGSFERSQEGLTLPCPQCSREIFVTTNAVEFRNRNVGPEDFAFAEDETVAEKPAGKTASGPPPARRRAPPGAAPREKGRRVSAPRRREAVPPKGAPAPDWSWMERQPRHHRRRAGAPAGGLTFAIVLVCVGVVALAGFLYYASTMREQSIDQARALAKSVADDLGSGLFANAGRHFAQRGKMEDLRSELDKLHAAAGPKISWRLARTWFPDGTFTKPATYSARFDLEVGDDIYELRLDLNRSTGKWMVEKAGLHALTPAERVGRTGN